MPNIFSGSAGSKWDSVTQTNKTDVLNFRNQDHTDPFETVVGENNTGWVTTQGGSTGDGQWHVYEVHFKKQTGDDGNDGAEEVWIDGIKKFSRTNLNLGTEWPKGHIAFEVNLSQVADTGTGCFAIDIDNIAISTTGYIGIIDQSDTTAPSAPSGLAVQ